MSSHAAAGAPHPLAERAEVRVVLDLDGKAERAAHRVRGPHADPARQDRRLAQLAGGAVDRPGQAHPDADDLRAARARLVEHLADEPGASAIASAAGRSASSSLVALGQHRVARGPPPRRAGGACRSPARARRRRARSSATSTGGRPTRPGRGLAVAGGSTTSRSACSSAMTAETVDGRERRPSRQLRARCGAGRRQDAEHAGARGDPDRLVGSHGLDKVTYFEIAQRSANLVRTDTGRRRGYGWDGFACA